MWAIYNAGTQDYGVIQSGGWVSTINNDPPANEETALGQIPHILVPNNSGAQTLVLTPNGTWAQGYRPNHMTITFEGGYISNLVHVVDVYMIDDSQWNDPIIHSTIVASGTEFNLLWGSGSPGDIRVLRFNANTVTPFTVKSITFDTPLPTTLPVTTTTTHAATTTTTTSELVSVELNSLSAISIVSQAGLQHPSRVYDSGTGRYSVTCLSGESKTLNLTVGQPTYCTFTVEDVSFNESTIDARIVMNGSIPNLISHTSMKGNNTTSNLTFTPHIILI